MSHSVEFSDIKKRVSFQQVAVMLGLTLKQDEKNADQWRGRCPRCEKDRALSINTQKGFRCFAGNVKGDIINLVAHIKDLRLKEAAEFIATHAGGTQHVSQAVQAATQRCAVPEGLAKVRTYLAFDHPAVAALGLDPATADKLGIGYKGKGVFSGSVVFPLYLDGQLVSYGAFKDGGLKFPPNLGERI